MLYFFALSRKRPGAGKTARPSLDNERKMCYNSFVLYETELAGKAGSSRQQKEESHPINQLPNPNSKLVGLSLHRHPEMSVFVCLRTNREP